MCCERQPLPQEIVDMLIDFLFDDHKTLADCSTVSRQWVPSTRFHLFREFRIRSFGNSTIITPRKLKSIRQVVDLMTASPWIAPAVRNLHVFPEHDTLKTPRCNLPTLLTVLDLLHNLTSLHLEGFSLLSHGDGVSYQPSPAPLETLRLSRMQVERHPLISLFTIFPNISMFEDHGIGIPDFDCPHDQQSVHLHGLRTLTLGIRSNNLEILSLDRLASEGTILRELSIALHPTAARSTSVVDEDVFNWRPAGAFLHHRCSQLKYLRLDISWLNLEFTDLGDWF